MANISAKLSLNVPAITALCKGEPGTSILNGTGVPSSLNGNDGDFFLDTVTYQMYGPRLGGLWGTPVQLNNNFLAPKWNSSYDTLSALSGSWVSTNTAVFSNSARWSGVFSTTRAYSGDWNTAYTAIVDESNKWDNTYSTVYANSAQWASNVDTGVRNLTGNWQNTYSITQSKSASWESNYSNVNANSSRWEGTYTNFNAQSANNRGVFSVVRAGSAAWIDTFLTVYSLSGGWQSAYQQVADDSQAWYDTTSTVQSNSANWGLADFSVICSNETTNLSVTTSATTFRMPYAMYLNDVRASVNTAPVGSTVIVDVKQSGSSIFSTLLSIDQNEETSTTAATPAVILNPNLTDDAKIIVSINQVGSTTAGTGLKITFKGYRV
jgi:hypothetical protein